MRRQAASVATPDSSLQYIVQMGIIQQADFPCGIFERARIDHSLALYGTFDPAVHLFQRLFKVRMVSHCRLDFDTVKKAFEPLCTQVNEITTAESFDEVESK